MIWRLALCGIVFSLLASSTYASSIEDEIASDLASARPSKPMQAEIGVTDPWEALRKSPPKSEYERFAGNYTWSYENAKTRVEKLFPYTSVSGAKYTARTGWIRDRERLYEYDSSPQYPNALGTSRVSAKEEITIPNPSQAFMFLGVPYDEMILSGHAITSHEVSNSLTTIEGEFSSLPFKISVTKQDGHWVLRQFDRTLEKNGIKFPVYVRVSGFSGDTHLPETLALGYPQPGAANDPNERICTVLKVSRFVEPITVTSRLHPGSLAVEQNNVYQVGRNGELTQATVPLRSDVNQWGWLYIASVAGLVFFCSLLIRERLLKTKVTKRRA